MSGWKLQLQPQPKRHLLTSWWCQQVALTLEILNRELGVKRLLLEGGGGANGAFLRAGLVDELSLILCPVVDGAKGAPAVFDSGQPVTGPSAPVDAMTLESSTVLDGGAVWLRYRLRNR